MNITIELFCEEIPARMQKDAEEKGKTICANLLSQLGLSYNDISCFVSPRRIALLMTNVPKQTTRQVEEKRGPRLTAPDAAMSGFLKSVNMTKDQLRISGDYYYADCEIPERSTADMMPDFIHNFLDAMAWPKDMHWHNSETNTFTRPWIRPIRKISVLLDHEVLRFPVKGLPIVTSNQTLGHRFLSPDEITVDHADSYIEQLKSQYVIASFEERKQLIAAALHEKTSKLGVTIKTDEGLLDEVTGLVDFPFAHIGRINENLMILPPEVLSTSMRVHQKYFTVLNYDNTVAPYFAVITNVEGKKDSTRMMDGFERVLTARLSDAHFFYTTDIKTPLESLRSKCDSVVFHEKTGTLGHKLTRFDTIIDHISASLSLSADEIAHLKRAARLCKSDLFTQMVCEFPELQGIMGRIYAKQQGEHPDVCDALEQHYQPLGPSKAIPTRPVSRYLALIDKVDTLIGFFGNDIKPTGNKDPLAIRRTALGIIRLIAEWKTSDQKDPMTSDFLNQLIDASIAAYHTQGMVLSTNTKSDVFAFIQTRFDVYNKK